MSPKQNHHELNVLLHYAVLAAYLSASYRPIFANQPLTIEITPGATHVNWEDWRVPAHGITGEYPIQRTTYLDEAHFYAIDLGHQLDTAWLLNTGYNEELNHLYYWTTEMTYAYKRPKGENK